MGEAPGGIDMADKAGRKVRSHSKIPKPFKAIIVRIKKNKVAIPDQRPTVLRLQEANKDIPKRDENNDNIPRIRLCNPSEPFQKRTCNTP
jgi:hypothetical protein